MIQFITWKEENAMQKMKGLWLFEALIVLRQLFMLRNMMLCNKK